MQQVLLAQWVKGKTFPPQKNSKNKVEKGPTSQLERRGKKTRLWYIHCILSFMFMDSLQYIPEMVMLSYIYLRGLCDETHTFQQAFYFLQCSCHIAVASLFQDNPYTEDLPSVQHVLSIKHDPTCRPQQPSWAHIYNQHVKMISWYFFPPLSI